MQTFYHTLTVTITVILTQSCRFTCYGTENCITYYVASISCIIRPVPEVPYATGLLNMETRLLIRAQLFFYLHQYKEPLSPQFWPNSGNRVYASFYGMPNYFSTWYGGGLGSLRHLSKGHYWTVKVPFADTWNIHSSSMPKRYLFLTSRNSYTALGDWTLYGHIHCR